MKASSKNSSGKSPGGHGSQPSSPTSPSCLWPPPVKPGDAVAVAAPASPVSREVWDAGVAILKEWGFKVVCGPEVFQTRAWGGEADRRLARRFLEIWQEPEVKAVVGARGGYGSLKVLPHLDLAALEAQPKRLVGFSDLTNLLWRLHRDLGLVTFHGPTVSHLPVLTPAARESFFYWLTAPGPQTVTFPGLTALLPGTGQGVLAGGNLTTLCHLLGTPFAPRFRDYILFLEDHNEALYRLDRLLHHLLLAGALEGVKGVVLGAFTGCGGSRENLWEVLATALAPLEIPVLAGLPVGHQPDNHTLPLGVWARVDGQAGSLTLAP
ncbi:MAG: LD-carboxypeptidase [Deltaproteobacteria bacterium]|nr:LD-carboxypeptidase [Deltaproteobacteria bacterium]